MSGAAAASKLFSTRHKHQFAGIANMGIGNELGDKTGTMKEWI